MSNTTAKPPTATLLFLAATSFFWLTTSPHTSTIARGQDAHNHTADAQDHDDGTHNTDHDEHDHEADAGDDHNPHEEHEGHEGPDAHDDHGIQDEQSGHEGHDDHTDDGLIHIDPQMLETFGIVVRQVGHGTLDRVIELPGEIAFNADQIAHVTPNVPGLVKEVNYSVGDRVEIGSVMAVLHSRELAAARSDYLSAHARLELARESLDRDERLLADQVGTERQVMETRQSVREAEIALNLAEQNLHALGQDHAQIGALGETEDTTFSAYELRAPLSGVVIDRHLTRGEKVSDDADQSPFVVADLSSVWVNLTVYQRDLNTVLPGTKAVISAGPGLPNVTGQITFVSPSLDEHTRTATARIVLSNEDGAWRPGMFITAELETGTGGSALVLPRSAVQELGGASVVFVREGDAFEARKVTLGRESDTRVEVLAGLEAGEYVVVRNGFALKAELNRGALEHAGHAH